MQRFPDLREQAVMTMADFDKAFGDAIRAIDNFLKDNSDSGFNWEKYKKENIIFPLSQMDYSQLTKEQSMQYIDTAKKRVKGDMPQRIYNALVAFHPVYREKPHMEMTNGYTNEYKADCDPKALGLRISFLYPKSWKADDGRRPHILQKFQSLDSIASAMIYIKKLPSSSLFSTKEDILQYLSSSEYLKDETPSSKFISNGMTTIAGQQASYVNFTSRRSTPLDDIGDIVIRSRIYYIIWQKKIVSLSFDVARTGKVNEEEVETSFRKFEKLFEFMAANMDFFDRYE
jgi:hypothetical protein